MKHDSEFAQLNVEFIFGVNLDIVFLHYISKGRIIHIRNTYNYTICSIIVHTTRARIGFGKKPNNKLDLSSQIVDPNHLLWIKTPIKIMQKRPGICVHVKASPREKRRWGGRDLLSI